MWAWPWSPDLPQAEKKIAAARRDKVAVIGFMAFLFLKFSVR